MSHTRMIKRFALLWGCLLSLPSGRVALSCCRRDFSNGSTVFQLSNTPDPACKTNWIADGTTVVDEDGGTDQTRVHHTEPHTLVLKGKPTEVKFQVDCEEEAVMVLCNDLCRPPDELQDINNAVNTSAGVFILLSIIILIFIFPV